MTGMTRYSTVTAYVRGSVERAMANWQRRPSLVAADELARLGELAFTGPRADELQMAFDHLAGRSVFVVGMDLTQRATDVEGIQADLHVDTELLDAGLPIELLKPLRGYAEAMADSIGKREATVNGNRAAAVETRATEAPPATYRGTWTADAEYRRGSMVTLNGVLWHAEKDRVTDRPGTSPDWKLMHKSMEKR